MGIVIRHRGSFKKTERFFSKALKSDFLAKLDEYGEKGIAALAQYTPVDSGLTADSWDYEIVQDPDGLTITWFNNNVNDGFNIALGIQYGHGVRGGGFVPGIDYINPALRPIFNEIAEAIWQEIQSW